MKKMFTDMEKIKKIIIFGILSVIFVALFAPYTSVLNDYFGIDTAQYWVIGNGILHGKMPYVDLFDHKGPIIFLIWAIGIALGLGTKWGVFLLEVISLTLCMWLIDKLCDCYQLCFWKKLIVFLIFLGILCGTIVEGGLTEEWAIPCGIYVLYRVAGYLKQGLPKKLWKYAFLFGIMFALIGGMRLNNAVLIGAGVLVMLLRLFSEHKYKEIFQCAISFCLGMSMITIPIVIWFGLYNALYDLMFGSIIYNMQYATGGLAGKSIKDWIKILLYIGIVILLLGFAWHKIRKDSNKKDTTQGKIQKWEMLLALLCCVMTGISCSLGYTWQHYFMLYLPCIIYGTILLFSYLKCNLKQGIMIAMVIVLPYTWQIIRNAGKSCLFHFAGYYDNVFEEIRKIDDVIPQEERDSVWAIGWTTSKYFAANDIIPCYKVFDFPAVLGSKELYDDTMDMLENNPPTWIMRFSNDEDYIEGFSEYLEKEYIQKERLSNSSEKLIKNGQEIQVELWRKKNR